jgi:DNA helicase-2/ATP-dependent DNA helicase PcrA
LLDGLTAAQRAAVVSSGEPLCILAGAGAGKTRVLTRRIAYRLGTGTADAGHVLALTFTRRAAGEMAARLHQLGIKAKIAVGTFHAHAYRQLRRYWADRGEVAPTLLERKSRLLAELVRDRPGIGDLPVSELATEIEWAKARLVSPGAYEEAISEAGRAPPVPAGVLAALFGRYEVEKQRRRIVDFDDLLTRCIVAFETDLAFAAGQHWRWRHFFVDEFQDVNPLQHRLLTAWLGERLDLCVVGDPNQAVYAWNGADPALLSGVQQRWPSTEVFRLGDNHRCSPQVVAAAVAVLGRDGEGLRSTRPNGLPAVIRRYGSERSEAHGVARELREARARGLAWSQLAVLFRTNAQASVFREALEATNVPYRLSGLNTPRDDVAEVEPVEGEDAAQFVQAGDAVTLSTFHRAKGLEWHAVWVTGLERGLVPIGRATTADALAEERRLLYVALTRAAVEVRGSWAEQRSFAGRTIPRDPSPWLDPIARLCIEPRPPTTPERWLAAQKDRLARCRRAYPRPSGQPDADPQVFEALRAWRATAARAMGVPPFVLLHDGTLRALAAARPSTADELLAVPGLGPVKVARYGEAILTLVAQHDAAV